MLQRNPRWQWVGIAVALALSFSLAAPPPAQAEGPAGHWQLTSILQSWWSGLVAAKVGAPSGSSGVAADPSQVDIRRSATLDPNGAKISTPTSGRDGRAPWQGSGRPRG